MKYFISDAAEKNARKREKLHCKKYFLFLTKQLYAFKNTNHKEMSFSTVQLLLMRLARFFFLFIGVALYLSECHILCCNFSFILGSSGKLLMKFLQFCVKI